MVITGRIGRLQTSERLQAFTDAVLAIICTSCAVPLWSSGIKDFNAVRLVPFISTFFILARLWEKHCQDISRIASIDEWLAQINVMWVASLSLLPFSFVVLFIPTSTSNHLMYIGLWIVVLLGVGFTSFLLSRASRRLSSLHPGDAAFEGWRKRDVALAVSLLQVALVVIGFSLLAWQNHLDILTDGYKHAFRAGHVSASSIVWAVGLLLFWGLLATRMNFQLLSFWLGARSPVLFDGLVPRVRVEIFSDGVYAAAAIGLMIELLNGLLGEDGGEGEEVSGTVWPGLSNYIYCYHIVATLHRSHQNVVAKIPAFSQNLLAINCLVCLSVAFIPTLSNILDSSWNHDPVALTTAASFLLFASLLLLLLLVVALKMSPPMKGVLDGIHESPEALLSEMLGRPLGSGVISGLVTSSVLGGSPSGTSGNIEGEYDEEEGKNDSFLHPLPLHRPHPRLFTDPSCLPQGAPIDEDLVRRLQRIRDEYEIASACILPVMALFLTLLTASFQLSGRSYPYVPLAFLLTLFVYSVERHVLRPRAAKQIVTIQQQLRQQAKRQPSMLRGGGGGGGGGTAAGGSALGLGQAYTGGTLDTVFEEDRQSSSYVSNASTSSHADTAGSTDSVTIEEGDEGDGDKEDPEDDLERTPSGPRSVRFE